MKSYKILVLLFLLGACSATKISYDYDREVDFERYKTFAVYPELDSGLNPFDEDRLLESIKANLNQKGINTSENPDFYVNIFTEQYQEPNRNSIGIGVDGTDRNVGVGISGGFPIGGPETYLRIIIDFVDVKNDSLIWQAVIDTKFDQNVAPKLQQEQFDKIINKALKKYPPRNS